MLYSKPESVVSEAVLLPSSGEGSVRVKLTSLWAWFKGFGVPAWNLGRDTEPGKLVISH